ncbi:MAG TPA: helix-turn-helix domain-containing protein [Micrococcales bacterium]|uniref:excisionase family DNA-binding protein n=1 Tax=Miniimonas TaxID=947525 RepID=UPI000D525C6B|nr:MULTISPECIES: helix-turn-helix domain-containing protein [Miniimonas]HCX85009.1 helix-turn-helix domain-containing protein [Micrococcales bacterium]
MDTSYPHYLTIRQAADVVGCSPDTIRRMIARGELRAVRFGRLLRIPPTALDRGGRPVTNLARRRTVA